MAGHKVVELAVSVPPSRPWVRVRVMVRVRFGVRVRVKAR